MKKTLTYALLLLFSFGIAQKMAYVDTQYILKQLPQYQQFEQRLNNEVKKWQEEIVNRQSALEKLRIEFENEKVLLTDDQQKSRLMSIDSTDRALHEFIEKKFGSKGESVSLRINLVKPIQDQIWNAINAIAIKDKYNLILDKSSDLIMVYTDSKYDITDKVLKQLGIATKKKEEKKGIPSSVKNIDEIDHKDSKIKSSKYSDESVTDKEESVKKQSKSGWGRKYVPKNKQNKKETVKEDNLNDDSLEKANQISDKKKVDTIKTKANSKHVDSNSTINPSVIKNKQNKTDISNKKEVNTTVKAQPKSGYGSKYIPKKKTQNNNISNNNQTNDKTNK
jgi:Skp family chaperone for outer membrane proteins